MSKVKNEMRIKTFVDDRPPADGRLPVEDDVNRFCQTVDVVDIRVRLPKSQGTPVIAVVVYNEKW